jgi:hypothetical protein
MASAPTTAPQTFTTRFPSVASHLMALGFEPLAKRLKPNGRTYWVFERNADALAHRDSFEAAFERVHNVPSAASQPASRRAA